MVLQQLREDTVLLVLFVILQLRLKWVLHGQVEEESVKCLVTKAQELCMWIVMEEDTKSMCLLMNSLSNIYYHVTFLQMNGLDYLVFNGNNACTAFKRIICQWEGFHSYLNWISKTGNSDYQALQSANPFYHHLHSLETDRSRNS